jgi:cell division protein FtsB
LTARATDGSSVRTSAERAAVTTRRNRIPVVLAAVAAMVILATSFPLAVLMGQHRQLSAEAAQLSQLQHQSALLNEQHQQLSSNAEVKRLAQQNYQLVEPGQSLFVILPPSGQSSSTAGAPTAGDPADQPLVSPSQAPNMTPDPGLPQTTGSSGGTSPSGSATAATPGGSHPSTGFWARMAGSLEFWK